MIRLFAVFFVAISFCFPVFAEKNEIIAAKIRENLPNLTYGQDGAIGADGKFLRGKKNVLNCAGFAKWIIDGFYAPLREPAAEDKYMSIVALRQKHGKKRGDKKTRLYEDERDPYFALDWTRNIATELAKARGKKRPRYNKFDLKKSPIAPYAKDLGFPSDKIFEIVKNDAEKNPNRIYLGSINGDFGKDPVLNTHYHVAVFIPYYEDSQLKVVMFDSCKESPESRILTKYAKTCCHLVWISSEGDFEPMPIKK